MQKFERDPGFTRRSNAFFERMKLAGYSRRKLAGLLDDPGARSWQGKLVRWGDPKFGVPPRKDVEHVAVGLKLVEAPAFVAWILGEREAAPAWLSDRRISPFATAIVEFAAANPAAATSHVSAQGGLRAAMGGSGATVTATRSVPSLDAELAALGAVEALRRAAVRHPNDRDLTLALAALEKHVLPSIGSGSSSSSWDIADARRRLAPRPSAKKARGLVVSFPGGSDLGAARRLGS